ncbi:hypothetical protein CQZ93_22815 [Ochrobactrum vermis]|nr:hypothetical protein CQZ93_22815 [Ochrobactrum vermis]
MFPAGTISAPNWLRSKMQESDQKNSYCFVGVHSSFALVKLLNERAEFVMHIVYPNLGLVQIKSRQFSNSSTKAGSLRKVYFKMNYD